MKVSTSGRQAVLALVATALVASGCTAGDETPATTTSTAVPGTTTPTTTTTEAPTPTTTVPGTVAEPVEYEHSIPVGPLGIEYRTGGDDLEMVTPTILAAAGGHTYVSDPVGMDLWILSAGTTTQVSLAPLDILNVTAMAAAPDRVVLVEVLFAPERQRVHELDSAGQLLRTFDLPVGARLEDGLSAVLFDDEGEIVVVLAGGAAFATVDETAITVADSISLSGRTVRQVGQDYLIDDTLVTADLTGPLGGLRLLGSGTDTVVLAREEVLSTSPIEVLVTVEWYREAKFAGSALVPLGGVAGPVAPGLAVTDDGRVVILVAGTESVEVTELLPRPERITAAPGG